MIPVHWKVRKALPIWYNCCSSTILLGLRVNAQLLPNVFSPPPLTAGLVSISKFHYYDSFHHRFKTLLAAHESFAMILFISCFYEKLSNNTWESEPHARLTTPLFSMSSTGVSRRTKSCVPNHSSQPFTQILLRLWSLLGGSFSSPSCSCRLILILLSFLRETCRPLHSYLR